MIKLHFNSVALTARHHRRKLLTALTRVVDSGVFLGGSEVKRLEKNLTDYLGGGYVTTVASGHDALLLALRSLQLKPTDEVIFPVNAYPVSFPVALSGARPVPVDVDDNGQLDPQHLKRVITKESRAVILVHLYGLVGKVADIKDICRRHHLVLIEDAAQAFGSRFRGKPAGTLGDLGCFSFYPTKNLGTLGDGGAVWTRRSAWFKYLTAAKTYGETRRYLSKFVASHSRLPELQAAVLNTYCKNFNHEINRRLVVKTWYEKEIAKAKLDRYLRLLESDRDSEAVRHLLVAEVTRRDELQKFLARRGVPTLIHYPYPVHLVPAFAFLGSKKGSFPVAERLSRRIISLPFHPYLNHRQVITVVQSIRDFHHG